MKPLAIDLFCGLGGWSEGLLAEGYRVVGFDLERHVYGDHAYPAQLVLQDVLTIHGRQFKDAALIVASPPCQEYSYMAMPWSRAKAIEADYKAGRRDVKQLTALFDACFRIQRQASEAAGRHIPLVVENVRGAQKWVGRSRFHFGSFHLWGDVPALMPMTRKAIKVPSFRFDGSGGSFQTASVRRTDVGLGARFTSRDCGQEAEHIKNSGGSWFNIESPGQKETGRNPVHDIERVSFGSGVPGGDTRDYRGDAGSDQQHARSIKNTDGTKQGGDWFNASQPSISRMCGSKSPARKAASAMIAKIPFVLASWIAKSYYPAEVERKAV